MTIQAASSAVIPLACVPGAIAAEERPAHFALIARLFGTVARERADTPGGYSFSFPPEAFGDVARFVANERKCCPFLTFELTVAPPDGAVVLRLTGPEGTRAFLDAELPG
jgi:hypothetical protein